MPPDSEKSQFYKKGKCSVEKYEVRKREENPKT